MFSPNWRSTVIDDYPRRLASALAEGSRADDATEEIVEVDRRVAGTRLQAALRAVIAPLITELAEANYTAQGRDPTQARRRYYEIAERDFIKALAGR